MPVDITEVFMSKLLIVGVLFLGSSCALTPKYRATTAVYCEKIRGQVICPTSSYGNGAYDYLINNARRSY